MAAARQNVLLLKLKDAEACVNTVTLFYLLSYSQRPERVTEEHWVLLKAAELSQWCKQYELPRSGSKSQMAQRLIKQGIVYDDSDSASLQQMCAALLLPTSGTNAARIGRLTGMTGQGNTKPSGPKAQVRL